MNIVLFGPPGAGKGTQSEAIISHFNLKHLSTGDLFRKNIGNKTALGLSAKSYMDKGNLVPDSVVIDMLKEEVTKLHKEVKGFIFDGFPRTVAQAEELDKILAAIGLKIDIMISLEVEEEELTKRLLERGKTSGRADDQDISKIKNRIAVYNEETFPVAQYYEDQGKLVQIDGVGSIDEIAAQIKVALEALR